MDCQTERVLGCLQKPLPFAPPVRVHLVGSHAIGTAIRSADMVDVAVEMPAACFEHKDPPQPPVPHEARPVANSPQLQASLSCQHLRIKNGSASTMTPGDNMLADAATEALSRAENGTKGDMTLRSWLTVHAYYFCISSLFAGTPASKPTRLARAPAAS